MVDTAVSLLLDIDIAYATVLDMRLLQAIEVETGILTHISLDDLSGEEVLVVGCMVTEEEFCLSSLFQDDEHTTVHHQIDIRAKDIDNLNGTFYLHVLRNINQQTILRQHRIQSRDAILIGFSDFTVIFLDEFRLFCSNLTQRVNDNALR